MDHEVGELYMQVKSLYCLYVCNYVCSIIYKPLRTFVKPIKLKLKVLDSHTLIFSVLFKNQYGGEKENNSNK